MADSETEAPAGTAAETTPFVDGEWVAVYAIVQCLSVVGFGIGYFWIAMAFSSQHNGTDADHVSFVGGLGWDLGVIPVAIATGIATVILMVLGWKAANWVGAIGALAVQGVLALTLSVILVETSAFGPDPSSVALSVTPCFECGVGVAVE